MSKVQGRCCFFILKAYTAYFAGDMVILVQHSVQDQHWLHSNLSDGGGQQYLPSRSKSAPVSQILLRKLVLQSGCVSEPCNLRNVSVLWDHLCRIRHCSGIAEREINSSVFYIAELDHVRDIHFESSSTMEVGEKRRSSL